MDIPSMLRCKRCGGRHHARHDHGRKSGICRGWWRGVRRSAAGRTARPELVIYVENAGDFVVPLEAVEAVHSQKVIVNCRKLEPRLPEAIGHAHDAEEPGA